MKRLARGWRMFKWVLRYELFRNRVGRGVLTLSLAAVLLVYLTAEFSQTLEIFILADSRSMLLLTIAGIQLFFLYFTIGWFTSALYDGRNIEYLLAFPLARQEIVGAYYFVFLIRLYIYQLGMVYPFVYIIWKEHELLLGEFVAGGVCFILLPIITLHVSLTASVLGTYLAPGGRKYRSISLSFFVLVIAAVIYVFRINDNLRSGLAHGLSNPDSWIGLVILIVVLSLLARTILLKYWLKGRKGGAIDSVHRSSRLSLKWILLEREFVNFVRIPAFMTNYCVMVIIGVFLAYGFQGNLKSIISAHVHPETAKLLVTLLLSQFVSLAMPVSDVAFSREGREWASIQSLPISLAQIFNTKLLFCLACEVIGILPAVLFLLYKDGFTGWQEFYWLLPLIFFGTGIHTLVKVVIDLCSPDFTWSTPVQARSYLKRYAAYGVNLIFSVLVILCFITFERRNVPFFILVLLVGGLGMGLCALVMRELNKAQRHQSKLIRL